MVYVSELGVKKSTSGLASPERVTLKLISRLDFTEVRTVKVTVEPSLMVSLLAFTVKSGRSSDPLAGMTTRI